jgi:hypothetical protein
MAHTPITAAQTDEDSPLDQTLTDLIRLALDDLETRLSATEDDDAHYQTHFNRTHKAFGSGILISNAGTATIDSYDGVFQMRVDGATVTEKVQVTSDAHWLEGKLNTGNGRWFIELNRPIVYATRVKPITFRTRIWVEALADISTMFLGMYDGGMTNARPANGIYLQRDPASSANWEFTSSSASSVTAGTPFTAPAAGAWVDVKIVWDAGGAACYINNVLKETLTATLPTTAQIFAASTMTTSNSTADATRMDHFALDLGGPLADAA